MHYKPKRQLEKETKIAAWKKVRPAAFRKVGISREQAADYELAFQGDLVWPWDPDYNQDRKQADPAFDESPNLIAYCKTYDDIAWCLENAKAWGWKVTCRSGGHNTAGYSVITGTMTIDMSRYFSYVQVDAINKQAVVGSGTNFGTLDARLGQYGLHVPGGECDDVCVGGYSQGGGYGFTVRQFSVNCDNIVEARVIVLDENGPHLVVANSAQNADLLWSLQGGTGNNYGVLVDVKYRLYPMGNVYGYTIKWTDPNDMVTALMTIQNQYAKGAPAELGFQGVLMVQPGDTSPSFQLSLLYNGLSASKGQLLITPLLKIGNPVFIARYDTFAKINGEILPNPNLPPKFNGIPPEVKESRYIAQPIDRTGWQNIVNYFYQRPSWNVTNAVFFEYYGGQINRKPVNANAFIHRDTYMDIYVDSFWYNESQKSAAETWLNGYMQLLDNYSNGHQYQNYPRRNTPNYQWAFWGPAIWTLAPTKKKYDPFGLMDFPMSAILPTDPNDPVYKKVKKADQKSRFPKSKIVYDKNYEKHRSSIPK